MPSVPGWVQREWEAIAREAPHKEHFTRYRLGQGWKYVERGFRSWNNGYNFVLGETSEGCVMLALADLCRQRGVDFREIYVQAYPDEPAEVPDLHALSEAYQKHAVIPASWSATEITRLIDDLADVNYHSLAAVVAERFPEAGT